MSRDRDARKFAAESGKPGLTAEFMMTGETTAARPPDDAPPAIYLLCLGHSAHEGMPGRGLYLKDFDFEAAFDENAPAGTGKPEFTADVAEAKRFSLAEFQSFYVRVPKCAPMRWWADGGINRPMTGWHWQLMVGRA